MKVFRALEAAGNLARALSAPTSEAARIVVQELPGTRAAAASRLVTLAVGSLATIPRDLSALEERLHAVRSVVQPSVHVGQKQAAVCAAPYVEAQDASAYVRFEQDPETGRMAWLDRDGRVLRYL
jgi:hypothetical protein